MPKPNYKKITDLFFETGMLKRQKHTGPFLAGVENPDSIADHITRSLIIASVLAKLENANLGKTLTISLIRNLPATRIGNLHKVAARYIESKKVKPEVFQQQMEGLPEELVNFWTELFNEGMEIKTLEAIVAKDAYQLELALTAKELLGIGYQGMGVWLNRIEGFLDTDSAREIFKQIIKSDLNDWWQDLKVPPRKAARK